jgi:hypothetical protein
MFEGISFISLVCIIITSILLGINVPKLRDIKKRNNDKLIITHEYVINRIEYPTNIPNINNFDDYTECNCGEHCISNYGICNKIYINDNNTEYLVHNTIDDYNSVCTIINKNCVDNINILDNLLVDNIFLLEDYINLMNNNDTIQLYKKENIYFIKNYKKNERKLKNLVIICSVFLGLFGCILQIFSTNTDDDNGVNNNVSKIYNSHGKVIETSFS